MIKAAIYTRISSDPTKERLGVQRQEAECRKLCEARKWSVAEVFEDDDRSAYSGKARHGYTAMLEAIEQGDVDAVVAWHPDRLHRSPIELEEFIALVDAKGTKVATVQSGEYDLTTPSGRMSARIVGAVARGESEHKSARAKLKARELALAGKVGGGGWRAFGFEPDRVTLRRSEAKLIRSAVARFLAGDTLHAIAADWNAKGVRTTTGKEWSTHVLRRMLRSARIAGWREHHGVLTSKAEWPAIISLADHHAVNAILADPSRLKRRTSRRYLLTGLLYCKLCGEKMVARPREDKRKQYVCAGGVNFKGCGRLSCIAEFLDTLITEAASDVLAGVDLDTDAQPTMTDEVRAEVEEVERRLDELAEMFAAGDIGQREWLKAREGLDARLRTLRVAETRVASTRASIADAKALQAGEAEWDDLPIQRQRAVMDFLVERIELGPALPGRNFFDPSRVTVEWRR